MVLPSIVYECTLVSFLVIMAWLLGLFENELELINLMSYVMLTTAIVTFVLLQFFSAPYGRYGTSAWGPPIPCRLAWFFQELPSFAVPVYIFRSTSSPAMNNPVNYILLLMFLTHYLQRTFIFSLLIRGGKPTPLISFLLAVVFCSYNGYMQGRFLTKYSSLPEDWISNPMFIIGTVMFLCGLFINIQADHILRNLRKEGETGYKIPYGGMFEYVSGANYLGEIIEWAGFALACHNLPAVAFFLFTASNTGPRAVAHHSWYSEKFREEYPKNRKAIIPFIL